jgi:hypothetical protein
MALAATHEFSLQLESVPLHGSVSSATLTNGSTDAAKSVNGDAASTKTAAECVNGRRNVDNLAQRLGKEYRKQFEKDIPGFQYYEYAQTRRFVCFLSRGILMQVHKTKFNFYANKYANHSTLKVKVIEYKDDVVLIVSEKKPFLAQLGLASIKNYLYEAVTGPFIMLSRARDVVAKSTSKLGQLLLIDLVSMLMHLRDGYFTFSKIAATLMNVYTIHERYMMLFADNNQDFNPQSGASVAEMILGFSALGLPTAILDAIKTFTTLTGKRIFESNVFIQSAKMIFDSLITIIEWIANPLPHVRIFSEATKDSMIAFIKRIGSSLFLHTEITKVCEIYSKYVGSSQILFDPAFRQSVVSLHDELKQNVDFIDYVTNGNNKYFQTTWRLFEENVIKSCNAFDTSGRNEPVCFVFEGEAGSGKSQLMNAFVALLKESGMTTICHSVPASEDGKDFYDDYENQEVFVMDDVGQQGKSQWRYLINYVSPVKYPLPCATASKKNTKFFNSKIVLCTTNHFTDLQGFTSSDCISDPEALYRRAHVIKVRRGQSDHFSQVLEYVKYDHINTKKWENKFINHTAVDVPVDVTPNFSTEDLPDRKGLRTLKWLYRLFKHVQRAEEANNQHMALDTSDLQAILDEVNYESEDQIFVDAMEPQSFNVSRFIKNMVSTMNDKVVDMYKITSEFISYYYNIMTAKFQEYIQSLSNALSEFMSNDVTKVWLKRSGYILAAVVGCAIIGALLPSFSTTVMQSDPSFNEENIKIETDVVGIKDTVAYLHEVGNSNYFGPQSEQLKKDYQEWVNTVNKGCKTLIVKDKDGLKDEHTQCIVSGKRIMLPAHLDIGDKFVDICNSWRHYQDKHIEIENVQLKLIKRYLTTDIAIYEIKGTVPLYKLNHALFANNATNSKSWYLINSTGHLPVSYDREIMRNTEFVTYSTVSDKWQHKPNSGFYTPYSAAGGCGTVLAAPGVGMIGFHVAGSSDLGFCVEPSKEVMAEIKEIMLSAPNAINFELDEGVISDFSGVRIRYETPIQQIRPIGETSFIPSVLHRQGCVEMDNLIKEVETSIENKNYNYTPVDSEKVDTKAPPDFRSEGTPAQTLKHLSLKSFARQGRVSQDELDFIKAYLRTLFVPFDDLSDYETAFGGEFVPALNKDSSNGYNCLPGKDKYFDFEKRVIKDEMVNLANRLDNDAVNDVYDYNNFMCRETFKDELRASTKVKSPRTFRVMPLGHIWWTKKIFGKLLKHFKNGRHETGISVGYNPYIDADILAKKLLECVSLGDADFKFWDGKTLGILMQVIAEVSKEFYVGQRPYMIDYLFNTIAYSFVLVNDEIWATTHGLPSGTWLTLLLNCLINKCLTALVIYRNKPNATVNDVWRVIDYVTGDDKVMGTDEEMSRYFNLETVKAVAESLGMLCTNGDKSLITKPTQSFDKLTYVKRHFRKHPVLKRYVGCLSLDTIMNTLQWVDSTKDVHVAMVGKMKSMQVESYLHSPNLYRELTKIFERKFPFEAFFNEDKVVQILQSHDGYDMITALQNKNFSF